MQNESEDFWGEPREYLAAMDVVARTGIIIFSGVVIGLIGVVVFLGITLNKFYELGISTDTKSLLGLLAFFLVAIPTSASVCLMARRPTIKSYLQSSRLPEVRQKIVFTLYYYREWATFRTWLIRIGLVTAFLLQLAERQFGGDWTYGFSTTSVFFLGVVPYASYAEFRLMQRLGSTNTKITGLNGLLHIINIIMVFVTLVVVLPRIFGQHSVVGILLPIPNTIIVGLSVISLIISELHFRSLNHLERQADYHSAMVSFNKYVEQKNG
ncbi:MAG: hypothetical protein HY975_03575 [Candidatus Kerfeldbacteria bacterium]|nr:hypothetical protein [Candidatus Kerfeldbacteria bacterium]